MSPESSAPTAVSSLLCERNHPEQWKWAVDQPVLSLSEDEQWTRPVKLGFSHRLLCSLLLKRISQVRFCLGPGSLELTQADPS